MDTQQFPFAPRGGGGIVIERAGHAGGWPDGLAWVIFAVLLALLLLAVVSLALDAYHRSNGGSGPGGALGELDLRYARGEMGRDEYLQRRADLGGPAVPVAEKTATSRVRRPTTQPT